MKFSLINVYRQEGDRVEGNWLQNHIGTLESATALARHTESVNSNAITVAVVEEVVSVNPILGHFFNLKRLDV